MTVSPKRLGHLFLSHFKQPRLGLSTIWPTDSRKKIDTSSLELSLNSGITLFQIPVRSVFYWESFRTTKEFYQAFPTEHMLIFQKDTAICSKSNSEFGLLQALEYDYVGAPWIYNDTTFVRLTGHRNNNVPKLHLITKRLGTEGCP